MGQSPSSRGASGHSSSAGKSRGNARFDYEKAYDDAAKQKSPARSGSGNGGTGSASKRAAARKRRKRKRQIKRLLLAAAAILVIAAVIVLIVRCSKKKVPEEVVEEGIPRLESELQKATVDEIYTYGTHLNMHGTIPDAAIELLPGCTLDMVLYNGEFIAVPVELSGTEFSLSEYLNGGLYLDAIPRDTYTMFIRLTSSQPFEEETEEPETAESISETLKVSTPAGDDEEESTVRRIEKKKPDEPTTSETSELSGEDASGEAVDGVEGQSEKVTYCKYFPLQNISDYPETVYYTMSSAANRVVIASEYEYPTMQMSVSANTDSDVYDVVIDPGHGGYDAGAIGIDDYCERDFTLPLSLKIKERLEAAGLKVALTRDSDANLLEPYGEDGRIARVCSKHAKYMISVHMNSAGAGGLEIYTANGIDYTFAEMLRDNIKQYSGLGDTLTGGTALKDIFSRNFTQYDVEATIADNEADGLKPYEPSTKSSYYFIIRETGGIVTGAYMDDRNPDVAYNPYCYSNTCPESYITELGYITVKEDLDLMINNMDGYARAIADSLISEYKAAPVYEDAAEDSAEGETGSSESAETSDTSESMGD